MILEKSAQGHSLQGIEARTSVTPSTSWQLGGKRRDISRTGWPIAIVKPV